MSGHSKWHSIKHKKGAADAKRGKVFTKHAKLVEMAARGGGDPEMNPSLRVAIDNAKADNVPNANIDRAIKKGTGELKGDAIEEVRYEAYGPAGVAILIDCLTDNKNRSLTNVRMIVNKNGGNLGEAGSVSYMFHRKGVLYIDLEGKNVDDVELLVIDAGADDVERIDEATLRVEMSVSSYLGAKASLEAKGIKVAKAELEMIPENLVQVLDEQSAEKIMRLVDLLEEDDDVDTVWGNFDIGDEIMERLG